MNMVMGIIIKGNNNKEIEKTVGNKTKKYILRKHKMLIL